MTSTQAELNCIIDDIRLKSRCSYLEKNLRQPEVPVFLVQLLQLMMRTRSLPAGRIRLYCVTAALVQMGLNIHETVTTDREGTGRGMRTRQLSVLAGDYFSSLFYRELADHGEIEGITRLSQAISDVNEAKMALYGMKEARGFSWPRYLELSKRIHGSLITSLSYFFCGEKEGVGPWDPLAANLMVLHALEKGEAPLFSQADSLLESRLHTFAMETLSLVKQVRPLDVRHDLIQLSQGCLTPHLNETLVQEG
ncbi:heptaprenyl diphosphate synthase component 1 [Salinithrix halophila]|uniref:Heptaprenyl diphosphate synthase component 1 n=1 Tax=Salinithrix halophila TaxID=1485204 RepID=A0ABV8JGH8_9BACL